MDTFKTEYDYPQFRMWIYHRSQNEVYVLDTKHKKDLDIISKKLYSIFAPFEVFIKKTEGGKWEDYDAHLYHDLMEAKKRNPKVKFGKIEIPPDLYHEYRV